MQLANMEQALADSMVGRREEVRVLLRCAIAQEHVFLFGPPGVGKTFLLENFSRLVDGATNFVNLLTRFSTPEELWGPNRITKLKQDEYERNTTGRLAEAHYALIDEIFKGSGAILNTLLRAMQERKMENGIDAAGKLRTIDMPLRMLTAASNEFPERGELDALYDRFLVRRIVKPVHGKERKQLLFGKLQPVKPLATIAEMDAHHDAAMAIQFTDAAQQCLLDIWKELDKSQVRVGDRRAMKSLKICKAEAHLCGANRVYPEHLECLQDVYWNTEDEQTKVAEIVLRHTYPDAIVLNEFISEIASMEQQPTTELQELCVRMEKLDTMLTKMESMAKSPKRDTTMEAAYTERDKATAATTGCSIEQVRQLRTLGMAV